jgi:hypothetical protein
MKTPEEIQELAIAKYGTGIYSIDEIDAYVVGYTQCQKDMAIQTMSNGKRRVAPFKQDSMNLVWENGYQMALLDNADKKYTLKQVERYHDIRATQGISNANKYIESLNKQD